MRKETTQVAEISISYHPNIRNKPIINSSKDAYAYLYEFFPAETIHLQERFVVMYLNRAKRVLGIYPTSVGGINTTLADVRLILSVALKTAASAIVLAHNHPSGNLKPSTQDIDLTVKIKEAGNYMDIKVLDHLILSPLEGEFFSLTDEGLI